MASDAGEVPGLSDAYRSPPCGSHGESESITVRGVENQGNSEKSVFTEGRAGVLWDSKSEDLDSDLYYNQEGEEEEVDNGCASSAPGKGEVYTTLLSEFDDFVANEKNGALAGASRALSYGFQIGDMVWGKVKSHPWWPGQIFDEELASTSVRRTRREGHVLVAFFGDSSYGWFDPAELIPFEDNFEEKAQQTNARSFIKAVEEAVDEASRRSGLGFLCKCRNPSNFRRISVDGYFSVDVPEFEPNGVYSVKQIMKSREDFQPSVLLDFVKQLAAVARDTDVNTMDFVKCKAAAVAFRKAVFEEFDLTYSQAFGTSSSSKAAAYNSDHPLLARAPLSGPLVIAEALGGGKNGKKAIRAKESSKKEKYVLKKRDDSVDDDTGINQESSDPSPQMVYADDSSALVENFVLQKRIPEFRMPSSDGRMEMANVAAFNQHPSNISLPHSKIPLSSEAVSPDESNHTHLKESSSDLPNMIKVEVTPREGEEMVRAHKISEQGDAVFPKAELHDGHHVPQSAEKAPNITVRKEKKLKRQAAASGSEIAASSEKKRRKDGNILLSKNQFTHPVNGKSVRDDALLLRQKRDSSSCLPPGNDELEVLHLLKDLHFVALESFNGLPRRMSSMATQFFLRFRSAVYQKSLSSSESDNADEQNRASSQMGSSRKPLRIKDGEETPQAKQEKSLPKSDDPSPFRKRVQSDGLEDSTAKRMKKMTHLKTLPEPKKVSQKPPEPANFPVKKAGKILAGETAAKTLEPTMLVMKFPPQTSLPSGAELKAKFARFGSIDLSAIRVFWKSSTCRVVFRHRRDAEAAFKYAAGNPSLFGKVDVRYSLREVATEAPDGGKIGSSAVDAPPEALPLPPKSILKKSSGEEGQPSSGNGGRGTRVKFVLGGEESGGSKGETPSVGTDYNKNKNVNVVKGLPQSQLPPLLPLPQFGKNPYPSRSLPHPNVPVPADISQQMLSLLARCNDVVSTISGVYGYVPYRPL